MEGNVAKAYSMAGVTSKACSMYCKLKLLYKTLLVILLVETCHMHFMKFVQLPFLLKLSPFSFPYRLGAITPASDWRFSSYLKVNTCVKKKKMDQMDKCKMTCWFSRQIQTRNYTLIPAWKSMTIAAAISEYGQCCNYRSVSLVTFGTDADCLIRFNKLC